MRFVGVDLAWGDRGTTGLAALDERGRLLDLAPVRTDEQILAWLTPHTDGSCLLAVDAPVVVENPTGRRRCEAELSRVFGSYDAGAHPCNTGRPELAHGSRALRLAHVLGLDVDPRSSAARRMVEVYPHPATVVLFGLDRTIKYKHKPGRDLTLLRAETLRLVRLVEGLDQAEPPLTVRDHSGWRAAREAVAGASRKADLKRIEDVVDAVVCAYTALFADRRPELTTVFGDVTEGYIVTPTLHPHPARPPSA